MSSIAPTPDPDLHLALPPALRRPGTRLAPIAAGMSGAAVYRVETDEGAFVLKVMPDGTPLAPWSERVRLQRLASDVGVAPRVVHVDDERRAMVSELIVDRSFPTLLFTPTTRAAALTLLADTIRKVHALPIPSSAAVASPRDFLAGQWARLTAQGTVPPFVAEAVRIGLAEEPPASDRPLVMSHNDANPTNLVFDGERLYLLDWETLAPNDWCYDLATASLFLRLDQAASLALLSAYERGDVAELPPRFRYDRRMVALLSGVAAMNAATAAGHPEALGGGDTSMTLGEAYAAMRSGALDLRSGDGQWRFGLALVGEAFNDAPA